MPRLYAGLLSLLLFCPLAALPARAQTPDAAPEAAPAAPKVPDLPVETVASSTPDAPAASAKDLSGGPWKLGEVLVEGLVNIKARAALGQVGAKKGQVYTRADANRDIQGLLAMGNFERVSVDVAEIAGTSVPEAEAEGLASSAEIRLKFLVAEKPLVRDIKFEGHKELGRSRLFEALTVKEGDPMDDFKVRGDAEKMVEAYREKGFNDAEVGFKTEPGKKPSTVVLTFVVKEGQKTRMEAVRLEGAKAFKSKQVLKRIENRPGWIFSRPYQPKKLEEDLAKIEAFYKSEGYLDYELLESTVTFNADRSQATLTLRVSEGPLYRFGATRFVGNTLYSDGELEEVLLYRQGKVFNQDLFRDSLTGLQELYANKGRLRARISPERAPNEATGLMDLSLKIEEGPVVYVGHVDVEGNKATKTHVLKREITLKPGEAFNAKKVQKSREKIMNLGFIDNVDIDLLPSPSDPDSVDLAFTVLEGKPGMLTAGAGLSSLDGLVGTLSLSHLNLFGRAQRLSLAWQFGSRVQDYQVSWTTPWIYDRPISLGVDVFNTRRQRPFSTSFSAFTDKRTGGRLRLGPRFEDDLYQLSLAYTYEKISVEDVDSSFTSSFSTGTTRVSSLGVEFARDTRDSVWDPARGSRNSIGYTLAGGPLQGDLEYYRFSLSNAWHQKLFSLGDYPFVFSALHRFGYVDRFGGTPTVPAYERFFIGGGDTLRGYAVNGEVGPPGGARVFDVVNFELKFPLAREHRRTVVAWVFFVDVGGAWKNFRSIELRTGSTETSFKTDVGFGIRFVTPAFPIRLDWGWGLNHRPGESKFNVNFGIGPMF